MHGQRRKSSFEPSVPLTAQGLVQSPTHIDDKVVPLSEVGLEIVPKVADEQVNIF